MSKFIIEFPNHNASALFEYHEDGYLLNYQLSPGTFEEKHFIFLLDKFPKHFAFIQKWIQAKKDNPKGYIGVTIREVLPDLSFDAFYKAYNQKFGKKQRSKAIWEQMTDIEKAKAINFIQQYDQDLIQRPRAKKNPETYLHQQIWNN